MHVDVAVSDTGLDGRNRRVTDHRRDQSGAAARYDDVDQPSGLDQVCDGGAVGAGEQLNCVDREILATERAADSVHQCRVGLRGTRGTAQQRSIAGLERQPESIDGDVRSSLVDHSDDTERHTQLPDLQTVRQGGTTYHLADRIR